MLGRLAHATRKAVTTFRRSLAFEATARGRRTLPQMWAQSSQSLAARGLIARRSAHAAHNSPSGAAFIETWVTNLVGDGPAVRSSHPDPDTRADLEARFAEWSTRADLEGLSDLTGILCRVVRSTVGAGEAVVHMPVDGNGDLGLRVLSPEQLDASMTVPSLGMTRRRAAHRLGCGVRSHRTPRCVLHFARRSGRAMGQRRPGDPGAGV